MPLWVRSGGLTFPKTPDTPVIMVGPGTGVAPFRAAIQERVAQGETGEHRVSGGVAAGLNLEGPSPGSRPPRFPRKRLVLRLPPAGPGLLLGGRVEGAADAGLPDSRHGLLPGAGGCVGGGEGRWGAQTHPVPPPCRSRRCTCSTGSGSSGRWCGGCWISGALTSTWRGEPGRRSWQGTSPLGTPTVLSPSLPFPPATPSTCQLMCRTP